MGGKTYDPRNSVFRTRKPRKDGKTDYFFNRGKIDGDNHGHVVESLRSTPNATQYDSARDLDGIEYDVQRSRRNSVVTILGKMFSGALRYWGL